jgi:hypothetical protein
MRLVSGGWPGEGGQLRPCQTGLVKLGLSNEPDQERLWPGETAPGRLV